MKFLVLGSSGNFGSTLVSYLRKSGHLVTGIEKEQNIPSPLSEFDGCFLAIPLREAIEFIEGNEHSALIEISSVKTPMRKYANRVVSIHPMFGPASMGNPDFRNIIFVDDISPPESIRLIEEIFPGFSVAAMSADEHDRLMVELLVKPYMISMLAQRITCAIENEITCSSHSMLFNMASISRKESRSVFMDTIRHNPYSHDALRKLRNEIDSISQELSG